MATVVHEGNGAGAVGGKARRAKAILCTMLACAPFDSE